jgi:periplasmic protein TonB
MKHVVAFAVALACGAAAAHAQDDRVYRPGNGVSLPQLVKPVYAQYTSEAMRRKIKGSVILEAVVKSDGSVGDVTVKQSLDRLYGLDDACVYAMKQWQFKPGLKDGQAVAVLVAVTMAFTMK